MTAEQDGLDLAAVKAAHPDAVHEGEHVCWTCGGSVGNWTAWPCLPYRLADLALGQEKRIRELGAAFNQAASEAERRLEALIAARRSREEAEALALDLRGQVARAEGLAVSEYDRGHDDGLNGHGYSAHSQIPSADQPKQAR